MKQATPSTMSAIRLVGSIAGASFLAILLAPGIAGAASDDGSAQETAVRVSYSDLNLNNQDGITALYNRLQAASRAACGPQRSVSEAGSVNRLTSNKRCYEDALDNAITAIDHPGLNRLHH